MATSTYFDAFATFPQCLDNEYAPPQQLAVLANPQSTAADYRKGEVERNRAVHREFIRALLYSPQNVVNRAYAVNESAITEQVEKYPKDFGILLAQQRLVLQLFNLNDPSSGQLRSERDLIDFLDHSHMDIEPDGKRIWRSFLDWFGVATPPYLHLDPGTADAVAGKFQLFFRELSEQPDWADHLFRQCSNQPVPQARLENWQRFLREEFRPWVTARRNSREPINRRAIYDAFICTPASPGEHISRRPIDLQRNPFAMEMRLIADMVYNANIPFITGRLSYVPSELPDPSGLPLLLFHPTQLPTPLLGEGRQAAGQEALTRSLELLQEQQSFFYRIAQEQCVVPDYAELTVADVLEIQRWDEWQNYKRTQADFLYSETLPAMFSRVEDYYRTVVELHQKLGRYCSEKRWKPVRDWTLQVGVIVAGTIGTHVLLPEHLKQWTAVVPLGLGAALIDNAIQRTIQAGLEITIGLFEPARDPHSRGPFVPEVGTRLNARKHLSLTERDQQILHEIAERRRREGANEAPRDPNQQLDPQKLAKEA